MEVTLWKVDQSLALFLKQLCELSGTTWFMCSRLQRTGCAVSSTFTAELSWKTLSSTKAQAAVSQKQWQTACGGVCTLSWIMCAGGGGTTHQADTSDKKKKRKYKTMMLRCCRRDRKKNYSMQNQALIEQLYQHLYIQIGSDKWDGEASRTRADCGIVGQRCDWGKLTDW